MKIAVMNIELGAHVTKGYWQYLFSFWKYFLPHSDKAIEKIAECAKRNQIDVLLCTEILDASFRSWFSSHVQKIASQAHFPYMEFFKIDDGGNAIFSRSPIIENKSYFLMSRKIKRILGHALIEMDGKKIHFFVTHLSLNFSFRKIQIQQISKIMHEIDGPVILVGDFNTDESIVFEGLKSISEIKTFPSWKPKSALDKIFIGSELICTGVYADSTVLFSDHLPLVAEIVFI